MWKVKLACFLGAIALVVGLCVYNGSINPAVWIGNGVDKATEKSYKDAKKAVRDANKTIRKSQKLLNRDTIDSVEHPWKAWWADRLPGGKISSDSYDKAQDDFDQAQSDLEQNQNTLDFMTKVNAKRPVIKWVVIGLLSVLLVVIIIFAIKNKAGGNRAKPVTQVAPVTQESPPALPDAHRSGRLKADYPAALAKDCKILGLDYDKVLSDFNGNAEAAYEKIHVQVLKKQYK